jgi:hypothetical protein
MTKRRSTTNGPILRLFLLSRCQCRRNILIELNSYKFNLSSVDLLDELSLNINFV